MVALPLADNPPADQRRITEHDPAMARLKARTSRQLAASIQQLVDDLTSGVQPVQAQSHFIDRHLAILRAAYLAAHREGQRDFYDAVSNTPDKWATHEADTATMQRRMAFYAPSVAKMAHEAVRAYESPKAVQMDEQAAQQWQQSLGARVTLQADLTWAGGQDGYTAAGWGDSANPFQALWWDLNPPSDHCSDCPSLAAMSPYDPPWDTRPTANVLQTTPGAGATECGAGCKCSLRYGPTAESINSWKTWLPQGTPGVPDGEMAPPTPPARPAQPKGGVRAPLPPPSARGELPYSPYQGGEFNDRQKAALDLYRLAELEWNAVRGNLAELPNFFTLANPNFTWERLQWDQLTSRQRRALQMALEAYARWTANAPDSWFEEGDF